MKQFKNTATIEVLGACFNGVGEMVALALGGEPKDGVYVGVDWQRYPCFDSEDSMYEDRHFTNLVFAKSKEELQQKMKELESIDERCNYRKLTGKLHPMVYWQGDQRDDVLLTEAGDPDGII